MILVDVKGGGLEFTAEQKPTYLLIEFEAFFGFTVQADYHSIKQIAKRFLEMVEEEVGH